MSQGQVPICLQEALINMVYLTLYKFWLAFFNNWSYQQYDTSHTLRNWIKMAKPIWNQLKCQLIMNMFSFDPTYNVKIQGWIYESTAHQSSAGKKQEQPSTREKTSRYFSA